MQGSYLPLSFNLCAFDGVVHGRQDDGNKRGLAQERLPNNRDPDSEKMGMTKAFFP